VLIAVAVGVMVVLFLVLSDEEAETPTTTAAATTETQPPEPEAEPEEPGDEEAEKPKPKPAVPAIEVRGGQPVGGVQELEFRAGERVRFKVTSDTAAEFHLHGYDVEQSAPAGGATTFDIPADIEGVFELEDHATGAPIAEIAVVPG